MNTHNQPALKPASVLNRRTAVKLPLITTCGAAMTLNQLASAKPVTPSTIRYCLNTSTINGGNIPVREQLKIAASAGYDAIELWIRDVEKFVTESGKLPDLKKEMSDLGLGLDSAIAFGAWIVDDEKERQKGLEQCRRDMETVAALGGSRIAAPPIGATNLPKLDLSLAAERYRALLELGAGVGVIPLIELWGFSKNLSTLAEVLFVAAGANHPNASLLLDVYHLYKGGFDFRNASLIPAAQMPCLHMNDYPAEPNRNEIGDKDRVYPGDGVAPISDFLRTIFKNGFQGTLSLELFNRDYWQQPAELVARTGLEKMKLCVAAANEVQ